MKQIGYHMKQDAIGFHKKIKRLQRGVSLIELLVALVIAGIILAGVVQVMVDNRMKFKLNNELAYIQENARFALDEIGRELRAAGYSGCSGTANVANVVNGSAVVGGFGLEGWDGVEDANDFPNEFSGDLWSAGTASSPDAFVVSGASGDDSFMTSEATPNNNPSAVIKILGDHDVPKGAIMIVVTPDCSQVSIFQNTQQNNSGNASQFQHNEGNSEYPGNCTKDIGGNGTCADQSGLGTKSIPKGSSILRYQSNAYYIGPSSIDPAIPSLYRESVGVNAASSAVSTAEELLIGVENMQLKYGVDTDGIIDGIANRYVNADEITGISNLEWGRVTSVRIELLLRSLDPVWPEDTTFVFEGANFTDRMLRQRISTSVQLRNLGLTK